MRTPGLLPPVSANIERPLSQTANGSYWPIVLIHESGAYVRNRPEAVARLLPYFRTGSIRNLDCQPVDRAEVTPSNDIGRAGSRVE